MAEDSAPIRELLRYLLEGEGYKVWLATDGRQAVEKARAQKLDLIMMDVMMCGMDGFEACRELKKYAGTNSIPVFLVSARGQKTEREQGLNAGAAAYIVKPFEPELLLKLVRQTLGS